MCQYKFYSNVFIDFPCFYFSKSLKNVDEIKKNVRVVKPHFTDWEIKGAINILKNNSVLL